MNKLLNLKGHKKIKKNKEETNQVNPEVKKKKLITYCQICSTRAIQYYCLIDNIYYCENCRSKVHTPIEEQKHQKDIRIVNLAVPMRNKEKKTRKFTTKIKSKNKPKIKVNNKTSSKNKTIKKKNSMDKNYVKLMDNNKKIIKNYDFPSKYKFKRETPNFQEFNRNIMDYIVEFNTKYLKNEGFFMETQGQLDKIQKNMGILKIIKLEMEDNGSAFKKHLTRIKKNVENEIKEFFDFTLPWIIQTFKFGKQKYTINDLEKIETLVLKKKGKINNHNQNKTLTLIKDLISLKFFFESHDKGILDLTKQDLGVYWFSTSNEYEMATGKQTQNQSYDGAEFACKPIKTGELFIKTGVVSRKFQCHIILTQSFLHLMKVEKNKKKVVDEKIKKRRLYHSIPLSMLNITSATTITNSSKKQEREQFIFRIIEQSNQIDVYSNSQLEQENWVRMIRLMKSRLQIKKILKVHSVPPNYPWSYSLVFHGLTIEPGFYHFDIKCYNSMWNIKKNVKDFLNFREELSNEFITIIFPKFKKKLVKKDIKANSKKGKKNNKKERKKKGNNNNNNNKNKNKNNRSKRADSFKDDSFQKLNLSPFIDCFLNEIFLNLQVSQSKKVRTFLGIDNTFNAILMQDFKFLKMIFELDKKAAMDFTEEGDNILHYAINLNCSQEIIKLILDHYPFFFRTPNKKQKTPILLAIDKDQLNTLNTFYECIKEKIHYNHLLFGGHTPLLYSAKLSKLDALKFFVEKYANINAQATDNKNTALHFAVINNNFEMVSYLLEQNANGEFRNSDHLIPLHIAIQNQNINLIKLFLNTKINLNIQNKDGKGCLHLAMETDNFQIISLLLTAKDVDINLLDNNNRTPLFYSIESNDGKIFLLLIKRGAKINIFDNFGFNIIHYIIKKNNKKLICFFNTLFNPESMTIEKTKNSQRMRKDKDNDKDSDEDVGNKKDKWVYNENDKYKVHENDNKCKNNHGGGSYELKREMVIKGYQNLIKRHGIEINKPDKEGLYPLHTAAINGSVQAIQFVLSINCNINQVDSNGNTAIHLAIKNGKINVVNFLLLNDKIDINILNNKNKFALYFITKIKDQVNASEILLLVLKKKNSLINCQNGIRQKTCLHQAMHKKKYKLARLLIEMGANLNIKDNSDQTALHYCINNKNFLLTKFLVKNGAKPYLLNREEKSLLDYLNHGQKKKIKEIWDSYLKKKKNSKSNKIIPTIVNKEKNKVGNNKKMSDIHDSMHEPCMLIVFYHPNDFNLKRNFRKSGVTINNFNNVQQLFDTLKMKYNINSFGKFVCIIQNNQLNSVTKIDLLTDKDLVLALSDGIHLLSKNICENAFSFNEFI
ncbi:ankyrin repeat and death domain-containing protein [Anaeramoeba flamelloides]|uniref:Ankyrin repeat and death domain-containing protein n=1 Tax=Anaeramoeba flamelloides TaxID=1746091 RepID=A0ABQ8XDZ5_9EUKA|nr:ankyrin repeat and death domain-containing protein [Anaeramoeba flamelloides]